MKEGLQKRPYQFQGKLATYVPEYPRAALVCLVQSNPFVGHGLAETNLPKGKLLHSNKYRPTMTSNSTCSPLCDPHIISYILVFVAHVKFPMDSQLERPFNLRLSGAFIATRITKTGFSSLL